MTFAPVCPLPLDQYPRVVMAHGGGGRAMKRLQDDLIIPTLTAVAPALMHDAALLDLRTVLPGFGLAMTTDSFVVDPLEFPGGDIGSLSVYGTVNDLAMAGATPLSLSVGLILEEGLPMATLWRLLQSLRRAADEVGVPIVTGDTKVVERGRGDGVYINTAGVGVVAEGLVLGPGRIRSGDAVLLSGDLGRHGIAVMACRENLGFETTITSDGMSLLPSVKALLEAGIELHCLRDVTRGGLVSVLNELALAAGVSMTLSEPAIPLDPQVAAACELLGFDPLYVACEGRFVALLPEDQAERACGVLRAVHPELPAAVIGCVEPGAVPVTLRGLYGGDRVLDMLSGEQLPRIC